MAEGKDCFRVRWTQKPCYSSGNIAALCSASGEQYIAAAFGSALNIVSALDGNVVCSFDVPLDDPVLHIDAAAADASVLTAKQRGEEVEDDDDEVTAPPTAFVAFSTHALQVYVMALTIDETTERPTGKLTTVKTWTAAQHAIGCLKFSQRGTHLASGATDGGLKMWDVHHHHLSHNYKGQGGIVTAITFNEKNTLFAAGTFQGYVSLIDFEGKGVIASGLIDGRAGTIEALTINGDDALLAVTNDRTVVSFAPRSLTVLRSVAVADYVSCARFASAEHLVVGTTDGVIMHCHIDAADHGVKVKRRTAKVAGAEAEDAIKCITFVADCPASSSAADEDAEAAGEEEMPAPVIPVVIAADASQRIAFYEVPAEGAPFAQQRVLNGYLDQVLDMKPILDADACVETLDFRRVVATNSKDVLILDGAGCASTTALVGHTDIVLCLDVSADGKWVATGGKDKSLRVWSTETQRCVAAGVGHTGDVSALCMSPKMVESSVFLCATVGADEALKLWDLHAIKGADVAAKKTPPATLAVTSSILGAHTGAIYCAAFAPNDGFVATGGKDKSVNVWQVASKRLQKLAALNGHKRSINDVAFSPADRIVASASNDGTVKVWSLTAFTCVKTLQVDKGATHQLGFFGNGQQLAVATGQGLLRIWAVAAAECVATIEAHDDRIWALNVIEKDGTLLFLTGGADAHMVCTEDYTAEAAAKLRKERDDTILLSQKMENAMLRGDYALAFRIALRLNHPRYLRQVITKWMAFDEQGCEDGVVDIMGGLSKQRLQRVLEFTREWVTNARHCNVAAQIVSGLLRSRHYLDLEGVHSVQQTIEALLAYSKRHGTRMAAALSNMHYVDYLTRALNPVVAAPAAAAAAAPAAADAALLIVDDADAAGGKKGKGNGAAATSPKPAVRKGKAVEDERKSTRRTADDEEPASTPATKKARKSNRK
jgi:U3 small nucleolar RNA-associated protein 13